MFSPLLIQALAVRVQVHREDRLLFYCSFSKHEIPMDVDLMDALLTLSLSTPVDMYAAAAFFCRPVV